MQPREVMESLERAAILDLPAAGLGRLARAVIRPRPRAVLAGGWLGHPTHPILVQVPIGAWVSAGFLDFLPGTGAAASYLTGVGVAAALPAVAAGLTDYGALSGSPGPRRVGVLHSLANAAAVGLQVASLRDRTQGRLRRGQWLGLAGTVALSAGGLLGGHLAYAHSAGRDVASR